MRLVFASLLAACLIAGCMGGSGTETSNGEVVAGRVFDRDGAVAVGARVYVRPAGYLKDTLDIDSTQSPSSADAVTDKDGNFLLRFLDPGSYKAEIRDDKGMALLLSFDLASADTVLVLNPDTLRPTGNLQGVAKPAAGLHGPGYVQLYGLDRVVRTDDTGYFFFRDLPSGQIRFRVLSTVPGTSYAAPALAVIAPGATTTAAPLEPITFANEDYAQWPFSRRLYVNTAAVGIVDTIHDFPLLVRLDAATFDFDLSDGKDVRFSAADGRHLPYQLDSWDPSTRTAAFWVKLDTLLGGNSTQYITMHFGRRDAPDFSDGKTVFASFGGVWHFSETMDADGEGAFTDASPANSAGMARVIAADRRGVVGPGAAFRGAHNVVAPVSGPAQRPARALTVSAWVYVQGTGSKGGEFLSMGDNYGLRVVAKGAPHFFVFTDTSVHNPAWNEDNPFNIVEAGAEDIRSDWHLVTGRYDGATLKIYIDGVERASVACTKDIQYPFRQEFWMGQHANGQNPAYAFTGSLDEMRVSPSARSPAWIRLNYLNQKAGSLLIEFR